MSETSPDETSVCCVTDCNREGVQQLVDSEVCLLKFRKKNVDSWTVLCKQHYHTLVIYYESYQKSCCDPLSCHKSRVKKGRYCYLSMSFVEKMLQSRCFELIDTTKIIPGNRVCLNCMENLESLTDDIEKDTDVAYSPECERPDEPYAQTANKLVQNINTLANCEISPIKNHSLTVSKKQKLKKRKLCAIFEQASTILDKSLKLDSSLNSTFDTPSTSSGLVRTETFPDSDQTKMFKTLMNEMSLKIRSSTTPRHEKVKLLTMLPKEFSRQYIVDNFGATFEMINQSRKLEFYQNPQSHRGRVFDQEIISLVHDIYQDDEYSRMLPGKKDCISVEYGRRSEQKRLMLVTVKELYAAFKAKYAHRPDVKIGLSKFFSLRPRWCVSAGTSGTHAVCCCTIHENVKLLCDSISSDITYKSMMSLAVCNLESRDCCLLKCDKCPTDDYLKAYILSFFPSYETEGDHIEVTFKQWVSVDRSDLVNKSLPLFDFVDYVLNQLRKLLPHSFIAKSQTAYFKRRKETVAEGEVICCMDFSENYSFVIQDEVQGYHWTQKYCTVHPCVCYFREKNPAGELLVSKHISFCFLSSETVHNVPMVYAMQTKLVNLLKDRVPGLVKVEYITDGCAEQYKNFKTFSNIVYHFNDLGVICVWSFYATSHGKSACDGLGGCVKRYTANESLRRPASNGITDVQTMKDYCQKTFTDIHFEITSKDDIDSATKTMTKRVEMSSTLDGTRSYHYFEHLGNGRIGAKIISDDEMFEIKVDHVPILGLSMTDFHLGDYVAFVYDQKWYVGLILSLSINHNELEVKSMHPHGPSTFFKWPSRSDIVWVTLSQVLCVVECPNMLSSRGQYKLSDVSSTKVSQMWELYLHGR